MCSNALASAPAPLPRAIARSIVSLGIDASRAFSTAFWSARLPAGSGPPSRAATMIARDSFEKSLPRLASAAPFLCLIEDHLLCPDMSTSPSGGGACPYRRRRVPYQLQKSFVHARVVRQLRMERGDD